jgi:hypothetical protein
MKRLLIALAALAIAMSPALARPQLYTQSIGWINPSDIDCPITSDHKCVVTKQGLAYTWETQRGMVHKYRVEAGTELIILDEGQDNEGRYPKDYDKGGGYSGYVHDKRVEVAIVIPSDWDSKNEELVPDLPGCHLIKYGNSPQIVMLGECEESKGNRR